MEEEQDLAKHVEEAGNALLSLPMPYAVDQLLLLLDKLEKYLLEVNQSPSNSVQKALVPVTRTLTTKELLNHLSPDVQVSVASCICEIMRISAPDAPYGDDQMKEIFKLIVAAFDNLSDISSPLYIRRVSVLQTFTKIRLWVVMLDLQCDTLILEMFELFLRNIRENHPDSIFMYIGFIMIMVLEESEEISPELLSPILGCVRKGNKDVLPVTQKLCERVIDNCFSKLVPYMHRAVQHLGFPLDDYSKIVACIHQLHSETSDHNKVHAFQDSSAQKHLEMVLSAESNENSDNEAEKSEMDNPTKKKICLSLDDGKHIGENLAGSKIKFWADGLPEGHTSCECDIVAYDPIDKKHKIRYNNGVEELLLLEKERWEFVGDEKAANGGEEAPNLLVLDASCKMHQNKRPKMNSTFTTAETTKREGISTMKPDAKISSSNNLESVENATKSESNKSSGSGRTDTSSPMVSENGIGGVGSLSKESVVDNAMNLKDDFPKPIAIIKDDTTNMCIKEGEDKNETMSSFLMSLPLKALIPQKLKRLRTPRRDNHKMLRGRANLQGPK